MKLNAHITFSGDCREAFELYARCLNGKILTMLTYGETAAGEHVPAEWRSKIMHATLTMDGNIVLYGADLTADRYQAPRGFHLAIGIPDPNEAQRIFAGLSHGGSVQMPLEKTFWAVLYGMFTDRFGVSWEINCEQPNQAT
jgi:PhnB protein